MSRHYLLIFALQTYNVMNEKEIKKTKNCSEDYCKFKVYKESLLLGTRDLFILREYFDELNINSMAATRWSLVERISSRHSSNLEGDSFPR